VRFSPLEEEEKTIKMPSSFLSEKNFEKEKKNFLKKKKKNTPRDVYTL
jgi:hypothetical protein